MKLREKKTGHIWHSGDFNTSSLDEIIVQSEEHGADSDYIRNYDVWIEQKQDWKDLQQAFRDKDVITDNHNTQFFEPPTPKDRERGYTL